MCFAGTVEEDISDAHHQVVDHTSGSDQVDEPAQNDIRSVADLQEGKAREDHDDAKADDWHTALSAVAKSFGCSAFDGESVQATSSAEGVGVAGTEDRGDQKSAYDVRQTGDAHVLHSNNVRRGRCGAGTTGLTSDDASQGRVNGAQDDTYSQCASHEEDGETPVDSLEGGFDVDAGTSSLAGDH